jgi:zinc transport system substrate-binding protein
VRISTCDLFIYIGGESDKWVEDALKAATNKNMVVINLLKELDARAKIEEIIEGMQEEQDHDQSHNDHEDEHKTEYDEHVWLSLKNAETFCSVIAKLLSSLDINNAKEYQDNLTAYVEKLSVLDTDYQTVVNAAPVKTLLFGDRFPFRYLADDYGLSYHAAFPGCSAETEASFETIIFLAGKMDELNLHNVMVTESTNREIAQTIINNTRDKNQQILALDSMQSVAKSDVRNGTTFLSIMENNLNILKEALR